MQQEPLVSVVTPFYNSAEFLAEAIDSVLAQSYSNFELLLVNNKSTDASREIAHDYAKRDPRIRCFDNEEFVPQLENYNGALSRISPNSQYVKLVQADDAILPDCLRSMVSLAESYPEVGLVSSYYLYGESAGGAGTPRGVSTMSGREVCRRMLLTKAFLVGSPSTVMYRANVVRAEKEFFRTNRYHADTDAAYRILVEHDFGFVHQVLSFMRTDNGITAKHLEFNPGPLDYLIVIETYGRKVLSESEFQELSAREWEYYWGFLGMSLIRNRGPKFWAYHRKGLRTIGKEAEMQKMLASASRKIARIALGPLRGLAHKLFPKD